MNNKVLNARQILLSTVLFSSAAGLVFFGNAAVEGAKNGMVLCADLLVPSIFPFMCLCSLICASGGGELVSKITHSSNRIVRIAQEKQLHMFLCDLLLQIRKINVIAVVLSLVKIAAYHFSAVVRDYLRERIVHRK